MENINKFLKYIENEDVNSSELSEHEKNQAVNLISLIKNSIPDTEFSNCEHDLEELCQFFEGKLENKELIQNQILECDSCFENYSFLKNHAEEIKNITPPYFKEKVYENKSNNELTNLQTQKLVKKSMWNIIKNNKLLKYSSGAVAAVMLLFFTLDPFDTNMSEFHKSKYESSENMDLKQEVTKDTQGKTSEANNSPSVEDSKSMNSVLSEEAIKLPTPMLAKKKNDNLPKEEIKADPFQKPQIKQSDYNKPKDEIAFAAPKIVQNNAVTPSKHLSNKEKRIASNSTVIRKNEFEEKENNISDDKLRQRQQQQEQIPQREPKIESDIATDTPEDKDESFSKPQKSERSLPRPSINLNNTLSGNIAKPQQPQTPPQAAVIAEPEKNKSDEPKPGMLKKAAPVEQKENLKDEKSEISINKILSLKFNIEQKGFIVIKDSDNKVIAKSNLLDSGNYNDFRLNLTHSSNNYNKYFYLDSNNNNILDDKDLIDKNIQIIENN